MKRFNTASLAEVIHGISPIEETWLGHARHHLDTLTKPLGSLGRLEDIAARAVAIRCGPIASPLSKAVYVFAGDHGITAAGVSAYPQEVTYQMVMNFLSGGAAVSVLSRLHGAALHIIDVGVDADFGGESGLLHRKVCRGTKNILQEAAMSQEQLMQAIGVGVEMANHAATAGYSMLAVGEMGIGNSTSASVLTCALTGVAPLLATGRGSGLDSLGHTRKVAVVEAILERHSFAGRIATSETALEVLRCVGGLEIAAMAGMYLAAAGHRLITVADGFISTAAAAIAVAIEPAVRDYLIAGHCSEEPGHSILLKHLRLHPVLSLGMRLGEGSGAVLAMPVIESALCLYTQMATFNSAGVSEVSK